MLPRSGTALGFGSRPANSRFGDRSVSRKLRYDRRSGRRLLRQSLALTAVLGTVAMGEVRFLDDIQPILAEHCFACHGPDQQEGGFRLDNRQSATGLADSGNHPIAPGQLGPSQVMTRVTATDADVRMPPEGDPLDARQIALLKAWILSGASYDQHWAYRPLVRPPLPEVNDRDWCDSPIDYFVANGLEARSIQPSPQANRYTLVKRLYYDLIGLPAPIHVVDQFVHGEDPGTFQRLVDRLLASPRFGERWGRHWLDMARYADSDGYEKDNARPNAWHYRDWVIDALNRDLPFDEFTIQQIAGDLLPAADHSTHLATAFHRQTLTNTEGGTDQEQWRVAAVMDRTETLGTVWLGLTVGCARCHSHKYDSISQNEYYQLYAFFNNADEVTRELRTSGNQPTTVRVIAEREEDPRMTRVLRRGDFLQPQYEVPPGTLSTLPEVRGRNVATLDRLDLARWLVQGTNPLPPRTAVNHIWTHLFGHGLVRTPNDFGVRGEPPTHPLLLDWLASELIRNDWSLKQLIRTIVLSKTYRQSSRHRPELTEIDPQNRTLHRQNRFRVEAEIMRDIALAASGLLSPRIGGPSVFPPIPNSITDLTYNSGFQWNSSQGEDRYRRGMYTFFKRTAPHPNLVTFDCPSSNITSVQRETSNTPIGALVTLNNTVYVEAASAFASQLLSNFDDVDDRLRYALRRCLARVPESFEVDRLRELLHQSREYYTLHPDDAQRLVGYPNPELAAWTATIRIVLNLDEFVTRE